MNLIVTLAGKSSRFTAAGYEVPKYMLPTKNGSMFEVAMRSLPLKEFEKVIFVVHEKNLSNFKSFLIDISLKLDNSYIMTVGDTTGQAETAYLAITEHELVGSVSIFNIDSYFYCGDIMDHLKREAAFMLYAINDNPEPIYSYVQANGEFATLTVEKVKIPSNKALVGFYSFASAEQYRDAYLNTYTPDAEGEKYIAPIYNHIINNTTSPVYAHEVSTFFDVGNPAAYEDFKDRYAICQSRYFNNVIIDNELYITTKKSIDKKKLKAEFIYYVNAPRSASKYLPKPLDYIDHGSYAQLRMGTVLGTSLDKIFLEDQKAILPLMGKINAVMMDLHSNHKAARREDYKEMYVTKTLERYSKIPKLLKDTFSGRLSINGKAMLGLDALMPLVMVKCQMMDRVTDSSFLHGDLCLSNMILAPEGDIKLIDPRGSWGNDKSFGDRFYDLAKLRHSLVGGYDLIKANQFTTEWKTGKGRGGHGKKLHLTINTDAEVQEKFDKMYNAQLDRIKLIEGLLFLTMIPLHADEPRHQFAFMAQAVKLLNETFHQEITHVG